MITRFTFTGADDSVTPKNLSEIQAAFPFVEWGILVAKHHFGEARFPSIDWLETLYRHAENLPGDLNLSMHLCGAYVTDFMNGGLAISKEVDYFNYMGLFSRVQLNTHGFKHGFNPDGLIRNLADFFGKEFIFQYDNQNRHILDAIAVTSKNISTLFDLSHGAGVLPSEWPQLIPDVKCGYAGGLSPENLKEQIEKIESIVGDTPIWIDIETHVRSNSDRIFDLEKVIKCCEIAAPYIQKS